MLSQRHLTLRLTRLREAEEWSQPEGLAFVFPKGGAGSYLCGRLAQRLAPGEVALVSESEPWRVDAAPRSELVFWDFSLSLDHLFPLFASDEISLLQAVAERLRGIRLYPASSGLARECHRLISELPPQFNLDHRGQLLRVAATILAEEFTSARQQRTGFVRIEEHLIQAFEKLSTEELLSLSVSELAERFGCSRRHLNRLFHHHFGFSVVGLRMEMRLLKAVSLLRDPDAKIIHVAEQAGFNHLGLFNTCFRKRFGTSPGQWRKLTAAGGNGPAASVVGAGTFCPLLSNGFCPCLGQAQNGAAAEARHAGQGAEALLLAKTAGQVATANGSAARTNGCVTPKGGTLLNSASSVGRNLEVALRENPVAQPPPGSLCGAGS